jgi:hypothetical protein
MPIDKMTYMVYNTQSNSSLTGFLFLVKNLYDNSRFIYKKLVSSYKFLKFF